MLAEKASSAADLPYACKKYPEAIKAASIQRTGTKKAYEGMQGGLAAQAQKAKGRESHAQIQRSGGNYQSWDEALIWDILRDWSLRGKQSEYKKLLTRKFLYYD
eukprot:scaffold736_cov114-Skeletonema_dohrnii-CCMP3373.AAC.4